MIQGLDHVALGVVDFDGRRDFLTRTLGLELRRSGTRFGTGARIALLVDRATRFKIELVETAPDEAAGLLHLAFRVENVEAAYAELIAQGLRSIREPHALPAAKAKSASLQDASGLEIQLIEYAPDSPDL